MFNQSVNIVEFSQLYNILKEIDDLFKFNIKNYNSYNELITELESSSQEQLNSITIVKKKNDKLLSHSLVNNKTILVLDEYPFKIEKFLDIINIQLIKQKYNFKSKLNIKDYTLNFNSRIISNKQKELKLTEREIDIILFLSENKTPQSIIILQGKVWGYSFDLETHTVETHIYRLRKKIKDKFNDDNFIISHDEGYLI